ncbi:serine/threonine-protein kinase [Streptomyces sp. NPDC046979]|uniref:serine/threonine-protein kinase n=1 Tax=Streptomyces sp. NPDC046979 TaxID=3154604 RepID=UPI0033D6AEB4
MEDLRAGDPREVGPYRLLKRLGGGGMGQVYLGHSRGGRLVAVKVVRAEYAADPEFCRRFAREVEAARRVGGFYTAHVVDADTDADPPWLASAYVPGPSLEAAVRRHGPLPEPALGLLVSGLAEGIVAVHEREMVHRDLKPGNVLLAADGPRLIDFGIAQAAQETRLTGAGLAIGTPGFMAPEYVVGGDAGPAADVFALGAVLAYAATGRAPFGTGAPHVVNYRAVHEEPDLTGVPAGLAGMAAQCLAKDPAARPTPAQILDKMPAANGMAQSWLPPDLATMVDERNHDARGVGGGGQGPTTTAAKGGREPVPTAREWALERRERQRQRAEGRHPRLLAGAELVAARITEAGAQARALAQVAAGRLPGDTQHGTALVVEAFRAAEGAPDVVARAQALAEVAAALAPVDAQRSKAAAQRALDMATEVKGFRTKPTRMAALSAAAAALAPTEPAQAEAIARGLGSAPARVEALAKVAERMAMTDPHRAERIARELPAETHPWLSASVLDQVVKGMAAQDPQRAERVARDLPKPGRRKWALQELVTTLAPLDPRTAERVARSLSDENERTSALSQVFQRVLETDLEAAERLARTMVDEEERANALYAVAAELRDTDPERALAVARRIPEDWRTLALADIAQSLAPEQPGRAEQLYQEAELLAAEVQDEEQGLTVRLWIAAARGSADPERRRQGLLEFPQGDYAWGLALLSSGLVRTRPAQALELLEECERMARDLTADDRMPVLSSLVMVAAELDPDWAARVALKACALEAQFRRHALQEMASRLVDIAPETAATLAAEAVHAIRKEYGDSTEIVRDALVTLAEADTESAVQLATAGRSAQDADRLLARLVEGLVAEAAEQAGRAGRPGMGPTT